jgi:phage terminase large subunit-like protein
MMYRIGEDYYLKPRFWIPSESFKNSDREDYLQWKQAGLLSIMDGYAMRPDQIANDIMSESKRTMIKSIAYDPYLATHGTVQLLLDADYTLSPLKQGIPLSPYVKEFERLVFSGKIHHGGHPILRWMMSNVVVDTDPQGNLKMNKAKSGNKIDGIAATINALAQFMDFKDDSDLYTKKEMRFL